MGLRGRVENGRIHLDESLDLPDGTVLELVIDDEGDDLTPEERERLHAALAASRKSADEGRTRPASLILDQVRKRL